MPKNDLKWVFFVLFRGWCHYMKKLWILGIELAQKKIDYIKKGLKFIFWGVIILYRVNKIFTLFMRGEMAMRADILKRKASFFSLNWP